MKSESEGSAARRLEHQEQTTKQRRGEGDEDPEKRNALVTLLGGAYRAGGATETATARADALDGDFRIIPTGDFLDLAVSIAEANEIGERARLAGRRESVETVALTSHDQPLQSEQGVFGRTEEWESEALTGN